MGIFLITVILLFLLWPTIAKWMRRLLANKAEDILRDATGMPPRPGSRKARRREEERSKQNSDYKEYFYRARRNRRRSEPSGPIIPKEYAEDVEFIETKEFTQTTIDSANAEGRQNQWHESQVSDVEWEEIRTKGN